MCFDCRQGDVEDVVFHWKVGAISVAERDWELIAAMDPERLDEHLARMPEDVATDFRAFLLAIFDGVNDVSEMAHARGVTEDRGWPVPYPAPSQIDVLAALLPLVQARRAEWMMGL